MHEDQDTVGSIGLDFTILLSQKAELRLSGKSKKNSFMKKALENQDVALAGLAQ